uniref:Uncharacterized protein n=1 Tax=Arundo donax TaxID=35708 RepID=A0A0A9EW28_ARUDO
MILRKRPNMKWRTACHPPRMPMSRKERSAAVNSVPLKYLLFLSSRP